MIWGNYRHNVNPKSCRHEAFLLCLKPRAYHLSKVEAQVSPLPNAAIITT
jgi:hypothetical protein